MRKVLLPLALPNVLTGIKTAAIISIGTATLAAFIGAGGLGEPIVTGLALNDSNLILQGAIPAACLAIVTELLFDLLERRLVKPHMLVAQLPT
jgi:osmoprotectant transport system permease protein